MHGADLQKESTHRFTEKHGTATATSIPTPSQQIQVKRSKDIGSNPPPAHSVAVKSQTPPGSAPSMALPFPSFHPSQPPSAPASLKSQRIPLPHMPPSSSSSTSTTKTEADAHKAASSSTPSPPSSDYARLFESSFDPNPPGYSPKNAQEPPSPTSFTATPPTSSQSKDGKMDPEVIREVRISLLKVCA